MKIIWVVMTTMVLSLEIVGVSVMTYISCKAAGSGYGRGHWASMGAWWFVSRVVLVDGSVLVVTVENLISRWICWEILLFSRFSWG
jgi:hypothetical protein